MESKWKVTKKKQFLRSRWKIAIKNWGCPPDLPVPPTLDLCPEKIETTVILSNEIAASSTVRRYFYLGMFSGTII